jgi:glycosyltransferase involved in cell wall biosynthesis
MVFVVKEKRVLVFAHVPPPHHGQSIMVQELLRGLRSDARFETYHVDARVSDDLEDIGSCQPLKIVRLLKHIAQALWLRLRHGPMTFYYVPAPAKLSAIARDWIVMLLCRPFFPRLVLHWHAYGLGEWVSAGNSLDRKLTKSLLSGADLAVVLNDYNRRDAQVFSPKTVKVVENGIEDLFPDYSGRLDEIRRKRLLLIKAMSTGTSNAGDLPELVRFLFLGHLTETKGVLAAIRATVLANEKLREANAAWRVHLTLAGSFVSAEEKKRVMDALENANGPAPDVPAQVLVSGFLNSEQKKSALEGADCLIFPTFYENEAQPLVLLEAMSSGLPVITTSWRGVASVLPDQSRAVVEPNSPAVLCVAMLGVSELVSGGPLRKAFERGFTLPAFASRICDALAS